MLTLLMIAGPITLQRYADAISSTLTVCIDGFLVYTAALLMSTFSPLSPRITSVCSLAFFTDASSRTSVELNLFILMDYPIHTLSKYRFVHFEGLLVKISKA